MFCHTQTRINIKSLKYHFYLLNQRPLTIILRLQKLLGRKAIHQFYTPLLYSFHINLTLFFVYLATLFLSFQPYFIPFIPALLNNFIPAYFFPFIPTWLYSIHINLTLFLSLLNNFIPAYFIPFIPNLLYSIHINQLLYSFHTSFT